MVHRHGDTCVNATIFPPLMQCLTIALMLSFAAGRTGWFAIAAMTATAAIASSLVWPQTMTSAVFALVWATVIISAGTTYLSPVAVELLAIPLAVAAGAGAGAVTSLSGRKSDLLVALPIVLSFIPGRWIVARGGGLGIKVVASWMIAVAMLVTFVSLIPTPGYVPDHME